MAMFKVAVKVIGKIFKYFCSLILLLLFLIPLILMLPILLFRLFVSVVIVRCYPKIDKLVATRSAPFAADDLYEKPTCPLLVVFNLEGTVDLERARDVIKTRLVDQKDDNGQLIKPEFQQYLTDCWGFKAWKWESKFDIKEHILMYDGLYANIFRDSSGPVTVTADMMVEISHEFAFKPFERKKSPWTIYLIHNLREADSEEHAIHTAAILYSHHSLGDGFSFLKAFTKDLTTEEKIQAELIHHVKPPKREQVLYRIGSALDGILSAPYELVTEGLSAIDGITEWHVPEKQLKRTYNGAVSPIQQMSHMKEITARHKVTFTALILECFTAAMRKFMIEAGVKVPKVIHCGFPLPMPGHPNIMTNHMTACFVTLPVGLTDPLQRFKAIENDINNIRTLSYPVAAFYLHPLVGSLFTWMLRPIVRNDIVTAMMSNLPGPKNAIEIVDCKVRTMSFVAGMGNGNCGMGFSAFSYNGTIRIAVGIDNGIVDKSKLPATKVIDYFLEEAELLRTLTPV